MKTNSIIQYGLMAFMLLLIPSALSLGFTVNKNAIYPVVAFLLFYSLFIDRSSMIQVLVALFTIIIVQNIYMYTFSAGGIVIQAGILFILAKLCFNALEGYSIARNKAGVNIYLAAFAFAGLLSSLYALVSGVNLDGEIERFQRYYLWALLMLFYGIQIRHHVNYDHLTIERIFAILTLCVSFLHMYALFTGNHLELVRSDGQGYKLGDYFRYGGVFKNVNVQGAFLGGGMCFSIFLHSRSEKILDKVLGSAGFVFGAVSILMSGSRTGLVIIPFILLMFIVYNRSNIKKLLSFIIGGLIATMALAATQASKIMIFFTHSQNRIEAVQEAGKDRGGVWSCSADLALSNPFGMGINNEWFLSEISSCLAHPLANPHNLFLDFSIHLGYIGAILFITGFIMVTRTMWKLMFSKRRMLRDDASIYFAMTSIFCSGFTEAFAFDLHKMHLMLFFLVGLTIAGIVDPIVKTTKVENK